MVLSDNNAGGMGARSIPTIAIMVSLLLTSAAALCFVFMSNENPILDVSLLSLKDTNNSTTSIINNHPSDHDSLIPLQTSDIVGFICAALGLIIAAGGGIGGGGILVPIYILILGFMPKHAIPLSNVTVFGGAIGNTLRNSRKRHPTADRPLIDWDLMLVMEPPTLAGALIGANLNKMLPETVLAVLLVLLLSVTAYGTLKKARKMYQKETEEIKRQNVGTRTVAVDSTTMISDSKFEDGRDEYLLLNENDALSSDEEVDFPESNNLTGLSLHNFDNSYNPSTLRHHGSSSLSSIPIDDHIEEEDSNDNNFPEFGNPVSLQHIIEEEQHPKRRNVCLIVVMFLIVLLINILKGGGGFESPLGIECGSPTFWVAQGLLLVWILFISWLGRRSLLKDTEIKTQAGYMYLDEDLQWDRKSTVIYPLISTIAGFCAGMFGIGGGIIKGPLMLAMGIHPAVASATSACMILFTSFTATTTFSVYGLMVRDYAIVGALLGFFATLLGQTVMSRILAKSQRNSYIAFSIGFVVLFSAILMALESVLHLVSDEGDDEIGGICDSHLNGHNS
mmetsp:Transcript_10742/g.23824  ORF Transcript_10742/g.23824 Transcript_10742/m.23824 type:complete len:563 (+) Transcript_10742:112-1800(+)|eukprot:CAMPEP_0172326364 /NCGR_PEP_ID=MMETSP1058-20130122/56282_1 /TAXON_ID=83371 /ORGANISM="Detonula confervacea, Strain CCMP 353" /LENGTH=562 /DNA_ID=CAMNT_0013043127 /DNA_START=21 /DNA_END=1709 /DNA_ORIENTATION=+